MDTAEDRIQPVMNAVAGLQKAHPEMHIAEFGQASADHVLSNKIDGDLNHARNVSLPLTLIILLFAFGAAVAAGIPVLLAFSAVLATFGLNSIISHVHADHRRHRGDHPDDRDGRRRRLLALLPPP